MLDESNVVRVAGPCMWGLATDVGQLRCSSSDLGHLAFRVGTLAGVGGWGAAWYPSRLKRVSRVCCCCRFGAVALQLFSWTAELSHEAWCMSSTPTHSGILCPCSWRRS
ncbi:hypothetical protein ABPG75_006493 [Micractinium tetrahymenae]